MDDNYVIYEMSYRQLVSCVVFFHFVFDKLVLFRNILFIKNVFIISISMFRITKPTAA